jgi:undecaprenyl-diphosphatase
MRGFASQWALFVSIAALSVVWLAMLLFGTGAADRHILELVYAGGHPALVTVARVFTFLGEPTMLVGLGVAVAAWLWWRGKPRNALALLLVTLLGRGLAEMQKYEIARVRPALEPHLVAVKTASFPSGHASSSMIVYLTLALVLSGGSNWRATAATAAIALSLLIGLSRIMLGVHWPTDVVGGWAFGLLWVLVALPSAERVFHDYSPTAAKQL